MFSQSKIKYLWDVLLLAALSVCVASVVALFYYENGRGGLMAFVSAVGFTVVWVSFYVAFLAPKNGPGPNEPEKPLAQALLLMLWPVCLALPISSCFFWSSDEKVYIVNNQTTVTRSSVFGIPFYDRIEGINLQPYYMGIEAVATTGDGKKVQGWIHPKIRFIRDESVLLRLAKRFNGVEKASLNEFRALAARNFAQVVSTHTLAELESTLILEWETGTLFDEQQLADLGLKMHGTFKVWEVHAYFGDDV